MRPVVRTRPDLLRGRTSSIGGGLDVVEKPFRPDLSRGRTSSSFQHFQQALYYVS
jgi:hypothetical protein